MINIKLSTKLFASVDIFLKKMVDKTIFSGYNHLAKKNRANSIWTICWNGTFVYCKKEQL